MNRSSPFYIIRAVPYRDDFLDYIITKGGWENSLKCCVLVAILDNQVVHVTFHKTCEINEIIKRSNSAKQCFCIFRLAFKDLISQSPMGKVVKSK